LVAAAFAVAIAGVMLANHFRVPSKDPLKSATLTAAKEQLRAQPTEEAAKQRIRDLDLDLRRRFFRHLDINAQGGWLLLAGAVLFLLAAKTVTESQKAVPLPTSRLPEDTAAAASANLGRWAVAALGAGAAAILLLLAFTTRTRVPSRTADLEKLQAGSAEAAATAGPTLEQVLANWPRFRGPRGDGVAVSTNLPLTWNVATGEGVRWKTAVPGKGFSSPVVWGDRVFVTSGDEQAREVLCFDADNGRLLWQKRVPPAPELQGKKLEAPEQTGFAAATAATDGQRVFAVYGTGELAAFDFAGKVVWSKFLGLPENLYGHSTSLLVWQGKLIVQFDQGDAEAGKSKLLALDPATGRVLWQQRRAVPSSWATPILLDAAKPQQVITLGEPWVIAYDFADGRELWRVQCLGGDLAPSPVFAGGLVMAVSASKQLTAIRPDGTGDVTKTHVAWNYEDNIPDITSPISNGELIWLLTTDGFLTCLEVKSGAKVWEKALDEDFNASPTLVGSQLLLLSTKGLGLAIAADRSFQELGRAELGEAVHASPALVGEQLYVRGVTNLFCLGPGSGGNARTAQRKP
jgi:outer membrane protein assembly factor BamB